MLVPFLQNLIFSFFFYCRVLCTFVSLFLKMKKIKKKTLAFYVQLLKKYHPLPTTSVLLQFRWSKIISWHKFLRIPYHTVCEPQYSKDFLSASSCTENLNLIKLNNFSKHLPSGPMLSISRFVCMSVRLSVCVFTF